MDKAKLHVGQETIDEAQRFAHQHQELIARLINRAREIYAQSLHQEIAPVSVEQVTKEFERLFSDPYTSLNLATLIIVATSLEAEEDYEIFIVDEILGEAIAETIAQGVPHRSFARGTFHLIDALTKEETQTAAPRRALATDDALAGLAAGLEAILPGWGWMVRPVLPK